MATTRGLTPTQTRIYNLLLDGMPHAKSELFALLDDELADANGTAVFKHVSEMRRVLGQRGEDVVCRNGCYYLTRYTGRPWAE